MILIKYELVSKTKSKMAKFQGVWYILIFNDSVWNNYIFIAHTNIPDKWAKIEKIEKLIEKIHKFDLPYGFCSNFHSFCPLGL